MRGHDHTTGCAVRNDTRKVIVVNAGPEAVDLLETLLDPGRYDMDFVESGAEAYSLVRHVLPDHVIVWTSIDDHDTFPLLSMLALDVQTRRIPTSICLTQFAQETDRGEERLTEIDEFPARSALTMN